MRNLMVFHHGRILRAGLFVSAVFSLAIIALTANVGTAHALFTSDAQVVTTHAVEAFPTRISGSVSSDYKVRSGTIDRSQLTVTLVMSDGTTRVLGANEYELSAETIPAGYKGNFDLQVAYAEEGHWVTGSFDLSVNEAYGATYGTTLVFGRGLPADAYEGKALTNTTWGIEEESLVNKWNPATLVSVVDIDTVVPRTMAGWFTMSDTLKTVELDQIDTSQVTSMASLFEGDHVLTSITGLEKWDTSNVTNMYRTFNYCHALTGANVAGWNTAKVNNMRGIFDNCGTLTTLDLSRWDVSNVIDMSLMFSMEYVTSHLVSVGDLSSWKPTSATEMNYTFRGCIALTGIGDVSGWNTSTVTEMIALFGDCKVLKNVNCSKWDVSKVVNRWSFATNAPGVTVPNWP